MRYVNTSSVLSDKTNSPKVTPAASTLTGDNELLRVAAFIRANLSEVELGALFRQIHDRAIDSPRTNLYTTDDLQQSKKTSVGTDVEIDLRNFLNIPRGQQMDFLIDGIEVDGKNSLGSGAKGFGTSHMIPTECFGHLALLTSSYERAGEGSFVKLGLLRIQPGGAGLNAPNKDGKRSIPKKMFDNDVLWIYAKAAMPRNLLLSLPIEAVNRILQAPAGHDRIAAFTAEAPNGFKVTCAELATMDTPDTRRRVNEMIADNTISMSSNVDGSFTVA